METKKWNYTIVTVIIWKNCKNLNKLAPVMFALTAVRQHALCVFISTKHLNNSEKLGTHTNFRENLRSSPLLWKRLIDIRRSPFILFQRRENICPAADRLASSFLYVLRSEAINIPSKTNVSSTCLFLKLLWKLMRL